MGLICYWKGASEVIQTGLMIRLGRSAEYTFELVNGSEPDESL